MRETFTRNRWLLGLCGILCALLATANLFVAAAWRTYELRTAIVAMCVLAAVAGACTIAGGIWGFARGSSWLLIVNGFALAAYGLVPILWKGPLPLCPYFALLLVVMAMSIGILALASTETMSRLANKWFLGLAGAASVAFALSFFALDLRWIKLEPGSFWVLLGSYFGVSAICLVELAARRNGTQRQSTPLPAN